MLGQYAPLFSGAVSYCNARQSRCHYFGIISGKVKKGKGRVVPVLN
jgi:hypothetical protein